MRKRIAIYVRVSTGGQSVESQRAAIVAWLKANGLGRSKPVWFEDSGASGDTLDRPEFNQLCEAVDRGEIETVIVFKLDRLSRSLADGVKLLADWTAAGVRVVSVTQLLDLSGTAGKLIAALLLGLAEMEQETRRERQAAGIAVAKVAGKYRGRKPGTFKAKPQRAAELRKRGLTVKEIARSMGISHRTATRYLSHSK